ncbi:sensor histidine kinase [Streptomyces sp. NPDC001941]|uniref:sensor histidine kinase n=1 Tax=Streptomyces sp. NPDC001941 TaxID=3154659 RepID=UPI00333431A7
MGVRDWRGGSGLAKVALYTRGTVYFLVWSAVFVLGALLLIRPVRQEVPVLAVVAPLLNLLNGWLCHRLARASMAAYLARTSADRRTVAAAAATTAALVGCVVALAFLVDLHGLLPLMAGAALAPFFSGHVLVVRRRVSALLHACCLTALGFVVWLSGQTQSGPEPGRTRSVLVSVLVTASIAWVVSWFAVSVRLSMWVLAVMYELKDARDLQGRLAVAEERLRFGRDLHDVMGRNLSVIALKSELAVQLARRGRPEAVDQMTEVQRIARESQREVRAVVRGYREADLRVELEGARGVLTAAGIGCSVEQGAPGGPGDLPLSDGARAALAWVVREATTNVLRHGEARHCRIALRRAGGRAELVVENDGARTGADPERSAGSGLAGLRERLAAVAGTLEAGPVEGGSFRVTARVPLVPLESGREPEEEAAR